MDHLRAAFFYIGATIVVSLIALFAPLTIPFPYSVRFWFLGLFARFCVWWLEVTCGLRYHVNGRENLPSGPAIVVANHQSAWETLALQRVFPIRTWLFKRELLYIPFLGWGLALTQPIAIDRKAGRKALQMLVEQGKARLGQGRWVVVFPEGTRVPPGERRPFHIGGAYLAGHTGYPIVPVAHNAGRYWPRKSFLKRPGVIELSIGPVIATDGRDPREINRDVEEWIATEAARLDKIACRELGI